MVFPALLGLVLGVCPIRFMWVVVPRLGSCDEIFGSLSSDFGPFSSLPSFPPLLSWF